jgi:hypothetical protein
MYRLVSTSFGCGFLTLLKFNFVLIWLQPAFQRTFTCYTFFIFLVSDSSRESVLEVCVFCYTKRPPYLSELIPKPFELLSMNFLIIYYRFLILYFRNIPTFLFNVSYQKPCLIIHTANSNGISEIFRKIKAR